MSDNFLYVVSELLKRNGLGRQLERLRIELNSNLNYPSLSSVSDTLEMLEIDHMIGELSMEDMSQISIPFLAQIKDDRSQKFVLASRLTNDRFQLTSGKNRILELELKEFQFLATGLVVLVEPIKNNFIQKVTEIVKSQFALLMCSFFFLLYISRNADAEFLIFQFFTSIGFIVSSQIILLENGLEGAMAKKFCGGEKFDCKNILFSKFARVSRSLKLSDLLIIYFSFLIIYPFLTSTDSLNLTSSILSLSAVPFVLYSLIIQQKLKTWCKLCLLVDLVVLAQVCVVFFDTTHLDISKSYVLLPATLVGLIIVSAWFFLKSVIIKSLSHRNIVTDLTKFRRNWYLLKGYLFFKKPHEVPRALDFIMIPGSRNGMWNVILVLQPSCETCLNVFDMVLRLQKKLGCFKEIKIVFNVKKPTENPDNALSAISIKESFHTSISQGIERFRRLKGQKKDDDLNSQNQTKKLSKEYLTQQEIVNSWCKGEDIDKFPTILIDNRALPTIYHPLDFEFLLKNLFEEEVSIKMKQKPSLPLEDVLNIDNNAR